MVATQQQIDDMTQRFVDEVFVAQNQKATLDKDDLKAALEAAYNWLESNVVSFKNALPEPAATVATNRQKAEFERIAAAEFVETL
jgi:hypothetical protein